MDDKVTKELVYASVGKYLAGESQEHTRQINGIYNTWDKDEKMWLAYQLDHIGHVGGTHTIVISRKTGEILADVMEGEQKSE